jgi:hypothetical protein
MREKKSGSRTLTVSVWRCSDDSDDILGSMLTLSQAGPRRLGLPSTSKPGEFPGQRLTRSLSFQVSAVT